MPDSQNIKANKILEINTEHDVFKALKEAYEQIRKIKVIYEYFI